MTEEYFDKRVAGTEVPFTKVEELFHFKSFAPVVCLGSTKGGKTVMALDIMYQFARDAHYVYYVSQSGQSFVDQKMGIIPSYFIRDPNKDCYDCVSRIWFDIKARGEAFKASPSDIKPILSILYPGKDMLALIDKYLSKHDSEFPSRKEKTCAQLEILTRLIVDRYNSRPDLASKIKEPKHLNIINSMVSSSTKTILILDDLSALLESAQKDNGVVLINGASVKKGEALKSILKDMFTRARHYNCIIVMFAHTLNIFHESLKTTMQQFLFVDASAVSEVKGIRRLIDKDGKALLESIITETDIFNPLRYKYYMLFYNVIERTAAITKAQIHEDNIPIHPGVKEFHDLLDRIQQQAYNPSTLVPSLPPPEPKPVSMKEESDSIDISIDNDEAEGI